MMKIDTEQMIENAKQLLEKFVSDREETPVEEKRVLEVMKDKSVAHTEYFTLNNSGETKFFSHTKLHFFKVRFHEV